MTRIDKDQYSVLIRDDYLYVLSELSHGNRQNRNKLIEKAVEEFLKEPFGMREEVIRKERPRTRITFAEGQRPTHHMYFEFVSMPDYLVQRMDQENRYPITNSPVSSSLGIVLNAAIRVFLERNHSQLLQDLGRDNPQPEAGNHL
jgi:hypothetical protein